MRNLSILLAAFLLFLILLPLAACSNKAVEKSSPSETIVASYGIVLGDSTGISDLEQKGREIFEDRSTYNGVALSSYRIAQPVLFGIAVDEAQIQTIGRKTFKLVLEFDSKPVPYSDQVIDSLFFALGKPDTSHVSSYLQEWIWDGVSPRILARRLSDDFFVIAFDQSLSNEADSIEFVPLEETVLSGSQIGSLNALKIHEPVHLRENGVKLTRGSVSEWWKIDVRSYARAAFGDDAGFVGTAFGVTYDDLYDDIEGLEGLEGMIIGSPQLEVSDVNQVYSLLESRYGVPNLSIERGDGSSEWAWRGDTTSVHLKRNSSDSYRKGSVEIRSHPEAYAK